MAGLGGSVAPSAGTGQGPYVPSANGYIVMEAESEPTGTTPVKNWEKRTAHGGFSGSGYYEWTGPNTFASPSGPDTILTYRFVVAVAGTYQIHLHLHQPPNAVWDSGNDLFLRVPSADVSSGAADLSNWLKIYVGSIRDDELTSREQRMLERSKPELLESWRWWVWSEDPRSFLRVELQPGIHAIEVTGRSTGLAIDRLVVFPRDAASPKQPSALDGQAWLAWPESPREP